MVAVQWRSGVLALFVVLGSCRDFGNGWAQRTSAGGGYGNERGGSAGAVGDGRGGYSGLPITSGGTSSGAGGATGGNVGASGGGFDQTGGWGMGGSAGAVGLPVGNPAAFVRADGTNAVLIRRDTGHLHELRQVVGRWVDEDLSVSAKAPNAATDPFAFRDPEGGTVVVYGTEDYQVRVLHFDPSQGVWSSIPLDYLEAPSLNANTRPTGFGQSDGATSVVYNAQEKIIRLYRTSSSGWQKEELTATNSVPPPADPGATPKGFRRSDGYNSVVYLANGHIHEFAQDGNTPGWCHADLTDVTQARPAVSNPTPLTRSDGVNSVCFPGQPEGLSEYHLYCLHFSKPTDSDWAAEDVSLTTALVPTAEVTAYVRFDRVNSFVFLGPQGNLMEAWTGGRPGWFWTNLTPNYPPSLLAASNLQAAYVRTDNISAVVYRGYDDHLHELQLVNDSWLLATID